jgi:hypothetical protein
VAIRPRRLSLPVVVSQRLQLARGERPLAWASDIAGHWYVGTDRALHLAAGDGFRKVAWEEIERADWNADSGLLSVIEVTAWGEPERRVEISVDQPGQLLELVRERVTKSVVINVYAPVRGRRGLSVIGRRSPAGDGQVTWAYVLAVGLDPDDPDVRDVASRTLSEAEAELAGL